MRIPLESRGLKYTASTFALSDLLAQGSSADTYSLTQTSSTTTFTLGNSTDISSILK